jgi:hypothetical protein
MQQTHVTVEEVSPDSREIVVEGRTLLRGQTLASLVSQLGGYGGEAVQPSTGRCFAVSLESWRGRDPQTTWLQISFVTDL